MSHRIARRDGQILLLMSGSIACAKASSLVSAWVKQGHDVQVACTRSVAHFIGHATLEGFSGHPVLGDAFATGRVMDHIHLARWADIIVAARH
jgi:phosphopantothenoylcysteine decarboxylase/phosphopantothenate--cysteine ligase